MEFEKKILIDEINKKENEKVYNLINDYINAKHMIELNQAKIESIEKLLNDIEYKTVGVKDLNVKLTITRAKQEPYIDYKSTIENLENKEDYLIREVKTIESVIEDKEKIENELSDRLVKNFKNTKTVIRLSVLDKNLEKEGDK